MTEFIDDFLSFFGKDEFPGIDINTVFSLEEIDKIGEETVEEETVEEETEVYIDVEEEIVELPMESNCNTLHGSSRRDQISRYMDKRSKRVWKKRSMYKVRSDVAVSRPRLKGRFLPATDDCAVEFLPMKEIMRRRRGALLGKNNTN